MRVDDGDLRDSRERNRSGERLEEDAPERVHVGTTVDVVPPDLLRSHVVDGSQKMTVGRPAIGDALRQPEVGEIDVLATVLVVEQDVRRLDVAVDEPSGMCGIERVGDLARDRECSGRLERPLASQELREVRPFDVAHRDEQAVIRLAGLVDRDHVRVVERGREPRLAQHPIAESVVLGVPLDEELQSDTPLEPWVAGTVDLAHSPAPDQLFDLVPGNHVARVRRAYRPPCAPSPLVADCTTVVSGATSATEP